MQQDNNRPKYIVAYDFGNKLQNDFQHIRPTTHDFRDHLTNAIAYVPATAVTPEDSAEEIANSADNTTDGVANSTNYSCTDVLQNLCNDADEFLNKTTDLNQYKLDNRYDDLNQSNDRLKY